MQSDFRIRDRGSTSVLSRRASVRLADIGAVIGASFGEVYGFLGRSGAAAEEPPFIVYHGTPGEGDRPFEIEICAPTARPVDPPAGWAQTELPAGTFASVLHVGPYATLGTAYDELEAWIGRQGFAIAGPPREVYLSEPSTPPADIRTVIEFPVVASTAAVPVASA
jgi:effector-binding domain-containing protein